MEYVIYMLMLFILLNSIFKLSLWNWWQRAVYSVILGAFAYGSMQYAVLQSKTQIADYLQNTAALQDMAAIVTIESAFCFGFALTAFGGAYEKRPMKWWAKALYWYPSLLMFPVVFYALTQTLFSFPGLDFTTTALLFAVGATVVIPLLAEGAKWLLPDKDGRIELHLILSIVVCVLGLLSTENGKMVYNIKENPVNWQMVWVSALIFLLTFAIGFLWQRIRWRFKK